MDQYLNVKHQRLAGPSATQFGEWSDSLVYIPPDDPVIQTRGKLFVVADITAEEHFDSKLAGRLILNALQETYYSSLEGSPLQALEKATLAAHHRLLDLTLGPHGSGVGTGVDFNLVAAVLWGKVLYISKLGTVSAALLREGEMREIGEGGASKVMIASGMVKDEDVLVLGSRKFREKFSRTYLQTHLLDLEQELRSDPAATGSVGLVVRFDLDETLVSPPAGGPIAAAPLPQPVQAPLSGAQASQPAQASKPSKPSVAGAVVGGLRDSRSSASAKLHGLLSKVKTRSRVVGQVSWKGKWLPKILILLGLLLLGSVAFTLIRYRRDRTGRESLDLLSSAQSDLDTASSLVDLNNERARELVLGAKHSLEQAIEYGAQGQVQDLLASADQLLERVNKTQLVRDSNLIYDLAIQSSAANPVAISGGVNVGGEHPLLFVTDLDANQIYKLTLSDPVTLEQVGGGALTAPRLISFDGEQVIGIDGSGFFLISRGDFSKVSREAPEFNGEWSSLNALALFGGNIYGLDPNADQVIRFVGVEDGYADGREWIEGNPDLPVPVDMALDGAIYILSQNGQIFKYVKGSRESFNLTGLDTDLSEPRAIFADPDLEWVFVLDRGSRRVVVVSPSGEYHHQYTYEGDDPSQWGDLRDVWVDTEGRKLYVLDGTRLFKVALVD